MDPAVLLLIVFLVYSILLGICIAGMRGMRRELDMLTSVVEGLGRVQQDGAAKLAPKSEALDVTQILTPELLSKLGGLDG